jgi:hypothetical protein
MSICHLPREKRKGEGTPRVDARTLRRGSASSKTATPQAHGTVVVVVVVDFDGDRNVDVSAPSL